MELDRGSLDHIQLAPGFQTPGKGSIFEMVYRRLVTRLGHARAIGAIAHRLCRLIWKILHQGIRYEERGMWGEVQPN